jgi:cell division control protein 6
VILDEIDQLISIDQTILYKFFEWAQMANSRLVLVGIANALDLTDRFLPRLKAKGCESSNSFRTMRIAYFCTLID